MNFFSSIKDFFSTGNKDHGETKIDKVEYIDSNQDIGNENMMNDMRDFTFKENVIQSRSGNIPDLSLNLYAGTFINPNPLFQNYLGTDIASPGNGFNNNTSVIINNPNDIVGKHLIIFGNAVNKNNLSTLTDSVLVIEDLAITNTETSYDTCEITKILLSECHNNYQNCSNGSNICASTSQTNATYWEDNVLPGDFISPLSNVNNYEIMIKSNTDVPSMSFANLTIGDCNTGDPFITVFDHNGVPHLLPETTCPSGYGIHIDFACPSNPSDANGALFKIIDPEYISSPFANPGCPIIPPAPIPAPTPVAPASCPNQTVLLIRSNDGPFIQLPCAADEAVGCIDYLLPEYLLINQDRLPANAAMNGIFYFDQDNDADDVICLNGYPSCLPYINSTPANNCSNSELNSHSCFPFILNATNPGTYVNDAKFFTDNTNTLHLDILQVTLANDTQPINFYIDRFTYENDSGYELITDVDISQAIFIANPGISSPNSCPVSGYVELSQYHDVNSNQYGINIANDIIFLA